jgi:TPR repeat protein
MPQPFLFVSHVSEDRAAASELVAELEQRGIGCWVAPRDVRAGKPYDDEIAEAIDDCTAMLLVFSDRCNDSQYIRREVTVAGEARKLVIPFRIEDAQPKRGLRIRLADLHWIDGFIAREQAIETLIQSLLPSEMKGRADRRADADAPAAAQTAAGAGQRPSPSSPAAAHDRSGNVDPDEQDAPLRRDEERIPTDGWSQPAVQVLKEAQEGDPGAQYLLAIYYSLGKQGVPKDKPQAFAWVLRAAEHNHGTAQVMLANMYDFGDGIARDEKQSLAWMLRAAAQGVPTAQFAIGCRLQSGKGMECAPEQAIAWFRKAAANGYGPAWYTLGEAYERGLGVDRNIGEAIEWYRKAAGADDDWVQGAAKAALQRVGNEQRLGTPEGDAPA